MTYVKASPVARSVPFDNSTNDFDANTVQGAIEEIGASASPGFSWGRPGNLLVNTWLQNDGVTSNLTGRFVSINNPRIVQIFTGNQTVGSYTLTVYEHDGNSIGLTTLGTISVVSDRGNSVDVDIPITQGRQLAIRLTTGSADNIIAGLILKGDAS